MTYKTRLPPSKCVELIEAHFRLHWPYSGLVNVHGNSVRFSEHQSWLDLLFKSGPKGVNIFAAPDGEGSSISINADRPEYEHEMEGWIKSNL